MQWSIPATIWICIVTHSDVFPLLVPIPSFDGHVITPCKHNAQRRMHGQASNVVWVRLKRNDLFMRVVIEHAQLEIVRTGNEPILARDKTHTSYGYFCDFECLYERARFKVVGVYTSIVQTSKEPGFSRVKVDRLDAIRALEEFSLCSHLA